MRKRLALSARALLAQVLWARGLPLALRSASVSASLAPLVYM
jgi:hypothetical protein